MKKLIFLLMAVILAAGISAQAPGPDVEVGFAMKGADPSGKALVLKVINSAKNEILVAAYNFTDIDIIMALIDAKVHRGVQVSVVHDAVASSEKGDGTAMLKKAGVPIRLDHKYKIMHNKFLIVDRIVVETGSFNYSVNANKENAENVLVLWSRPDIAAKYMGIWTELWNESV